MKKTESSDGTAYYNDEVAYVEGKDGTVIGIMSDGEWTSMSSDGVTVFVNKDGSWAVANSKDNLYTVVKADGTGAIMNTKTLEEGTDVSAIKTPKTPGRIDGFNGTPVTPVKATKIGKFSRGRRLHEEVNRNSFPNLGSDTPCASERDAFGVFLGSREE